MGQKNPEVEDFFLTANKWREEYERLRSILLEAGLTEELKWGVPCYLFQGKNLVLIHGFKEYCAILFFQGALLPDPESLLVRQTANVQAARQMRFSDMNDIEKSASSIRRFLQEAIEVEKNGLKVPRRDPSALEYPEELAEAFRNVATLKDAFEALTPGRKRAYVLFFSSPKQAKTRQDRIGKSIPRILAGKGLDDR